MTIIYLSGTLSIHGLDISSDDIESFSRKIRRAIIDIHPNIRFDDDVEFTIDEIVNDKSLLNSVPDI